MSELIFREPVNAPIGDGYGDRGGRHYGIDYQTPIGTTIRASERGKVVRASYNERRTSSGGTYGSVVIIDHTPYAKDSERHLYTLYAHLHEVKVRAGRVVLGQPIGTSGNTGTRAFFENRPGGRHLHFEIMDNQAYIAWETNGPSLGIDGHTGRKDPLTYFDCPMEVKGTTDTSIGSGPVLKATWRRMRCLKKR